MTISDILIADELEILRNSNDPEDVIAFYELLEIASDCALDIYITKEHYSIPQ